ncbi:hypothetical protein B0H21DRAFT_831680 [Amylocystis lapponica]|nr:hypothetical protein B0H21DRAFT_831680 [Amylocystis lapponica]
MPVRDFMDEFLCETDLADMPSSVNAFEDVPADPPLEKDIYEPLIRAINGGNKDKNNDNDIDDGDVGNDDDDSDDDSKDKTYGESSAQQNRKKKATATTKRPTATMKKSTATKKEKEKAAEKSVTRRPSRCPGFVFKNTSTRGENNELGSMKPDVCCYDEKTAHLAIASNNKPCAHLGYAELFIEVKRTVAHDFFNDPLDDADRSKHQFMLDISNKKDCDHAAEALGQNVAYAAEACARQHRTFYLSMSLAGTSLRFIRWDRAGAIVSESFDIRTQPELLWRGYDPTVEFAEEGDEDRFLEAISARVKIETGFEGKELEDAIDEHYKPGVVTAINVVDGSGEHSELLLVSRPVVSPLSVAGRATRGYWAVTTLNDVVFLKDTWRYLAIPTEGANIEDMEQAGVFRRKRRCPTLQSRKTKMFLHYVSNRHEPINSKLAAGVEDGGYPLKRFVDAEELLRTTFHAYQALTSAYTMNNRLHRDISVGNIILVRETAGGARRGVLIDWEFSIIIDSNGGDRGYERTGTWNFMSGRLLEEPGLRHIIQDDMESMLWVILYCGYLWLPVEALKKIHKLDRTVYDLFEFGEYNDELNVVIGGIAKRHNALSREYTKRFKFACVPFQKFCETMMDYHHPLDNNKVELAGKWEHPLHFEEVWDTFLRTNKDNFVGISAKKSDNKVANAPRPVAGHYYSATRPSIQDSNNRLLNAGAAPPAAPLRVSKRKADEALETDAAVKRSRTIGGSGGVRDGQVQKRTMARPQGALGVAGPSAGAARDAVRNESTAGESSNGQGSNGGVGGPRRSARLRSMQSARDSSSLTKKVRRH